jgi:hypothetical protein
MPFDQFQKGFLFRIAEELDRESFLYEVLSSNRGLSECPLLWNARPPLLPPPKKATKCPVYSNAYTIASCRTSSSDDESRPP